MSAFIIGQGGKGGGGSSSNPSVGPTGTPAPNFATEVGFIDGTGELQGVSPTERLPVELDGSVIQPVEIIQASLPVGSANPLYVQFDTAQHVIVDSGASGGAQFAMGSAQSASALGTIALGYDGANVRGVLVSTTGQIHAIIDSIPTVSITGTVTAITDALPAGSNLIGGVEIYDAAGTNKLAVDSSGYITVANTSFASTQSGNWSVRLQDGSGNVITSSGGALSVTLSAASMGTRQAVSFTSSTSANTSNTVALTGYANVSVTLHYSGSVTGGQMYFEVSDDNSNWYGITMAPTDSSVAIALDNYLLSSAAGNITWQMFVGGYSYFRVRMGVQVVGAGTAIVAITPSTLPTEPAVQVAGISDGGTHGPVAVKSANVAATAADPALVVTLNGSTTAGSPANTAVTSTSGSILAANTARRECIVVNVSTVVVYLGLGQTPTDTAYHIALPPCSSANDGTGGVFVSDIFKGQINAIVASTSGAVAVTEMT